MFCGDTTLIGASTRDLKLVPLKCKRWSCDECMPRRLSQLRDLAASGQPTTLITLTVQPNNYETPTEACKDLIRLWRLIRQRANREAKAQKIPFLAIIEETKKGWPHVHILARCPYLPQAWLSAAANDLIGAPIVDIRRIYNRRHASRYVAKYVSKGPGHYEGCKRYWRSQDYVSGSDSKPIHDSESRTWWHSLMNYRELGRLLLNCDWHHSNQNPTTLTFSPRSNARWLWPEQKPPPTMETRPCKPMPN